jgi:hypothetical protein
VEQHARAVDGHEVMSTVPDLDQFAVNCKNRMCLTWITQCVPTALTSLAGSAAELELLGECCVATGLSVRKSNDYLRMMPTELKLREMAAMLVYATA